MINDCFDVDVNSKLGFLFQALCKVIPYHYDVNSISYNTWGTRKIQDCADLAFMQKGTHCATISWNAGFTSKIWEAKQWVQGKVSPSEIHCDWKKKCRNKNRIYTLCKHLEICKATWKGKSTNPIILLHSCTVTCSYTFWHAICIHFLLLLLLLLGISVYYTVIDYQPLPPLFFPLSHIQEVKAPAPLAMAREWVEDLSHVNTH